MASVFREDTGERLGYLIGLHGPLAVGIKDWPFRAWRHSNGNLRGEPEAPIVRAGRLTAPAPLTVRIAVSNIESPDVYLNVPQNLVDFIVNHVDFRATPPMPLAP
jgi:hypothetical protein